MLEAGCGVGAQTITLAAQSPHAMITSIDISHDSVAQARTAVSAAGFSNVEVRQADIFALPLLHVLQSRWAPAPCSRKSCLK